jgi:hypothetical protein
MVSRNEAIAEAGRLDPSAVRDVRTELGSAGNKPKWKDVSAGYGAETS